MNVFWRVTFVVVVLAAIGTIYWLSSDPGPQRQPGTERIITPPALRMLPVVVMQ